MGDRYAAVPGRCRAGVFLSSPPNPIAIGRQLRLSIIRRTVIDDDDLYIPVGLPEEIFNRFAHHLGSIVSRNDYAD